MAYTLEIFYFCFYWWYKYTLMYVYIQVDYTELKSQNFKDFNVVLYVHIFLMNY